MAVFTKEMAEEALQDPNVRKFLDVIKYTEGTYNFSDPYLAAGGSKGRLLDTGYAGHPGQYGKGKWTFKKTDGTTGVSSANGAYQFLLPTWLELQKALSLPDFSPHSQDLAAVYRLNQRGALAPLRAGDFMQAIQLTGKEWASLPTAPAEYKQNKFSWDRMGKAFAHAGLDPTLIGATATVDMGTPKAKLTPVVSTTAARRMPPPVDLMSYLTTPIPQVAVAQGQQPALRDPANADVRQWLTGPNTWFINNTPWG